MSEYIKPPVSGNKPSSIVLLLHGYGSNGQDLIGLADMWADGLPDTLFVSPDAFAPCEMGFGFQWFSLQSWLPQHLLGGAEAVAVQLNSYIDELLERYGLDESKLALVGFSQGTMMSLYIAPRRKKAVAGVLGYSGALLGGEGLAKNAAAVRMPIHLVHGDVDPVVHVGAYYHAAETLKQAGYEVTGGVTRGLVHSIDEPGLRDGLSFLQRILT
jgi:phospholipase/carboxylesterase